MWGEKQKRGKRPMAAAFDLRTQANGRARYWKHRGSLSQCPISSPRFMGAKGQFYGGRSQVHFPTSCHCFYGCRIRCSGGRSNFLTPKSRLRGYALELECSGGSLLIPHFPDWNRGCSSSPGKLVIPGSLALSPFLRPFLSWARS